MYIAFWPTPAGADGSAAALYSVLTLASCRCRNRRDDERVPRDYSANAKTAMSTQTFTHSSSSAEQHANRSTHMKSTMAFRIKDTHTATENICSTTPQQLSATRLVMHMVDFVGLYLSAHCAEQPADQSANKSAEQPAASMAFELLEQTFFLFADNLDLDTWCRFRAACKSVHENVMTTHCRALDNYSMKQARASIMRELNAKREEAARLAQQMISQNGWSEEDPHCCSLHCCNNFKKKTGIWTPPHVVSADELPEGARLDEIVWWQNKPYVRNNYPTSYKQQKLSTMMEQWKRLNRIEYCYVVCSESCYYDVQQPLETIHWRSRKEFHTFLGVGQLPRRAVDTALDKWQSEFSVGNHLDDWREEET